MTNVYKGGLPTEAGKNLFPSSSSDMSPSQPNDGPDAISKKNGGPATFEGGETNDFLNDSSYQPKDMQEREGGMKVRDLNDVSNS